MKSMFKFGSILGIICLIATGLLASTNAVTYRTIAVQAEQELQDSLKEIIPDAARFEPVTVNNETAYFKAYNAEGHWTGSAFLVSAKGYSSNINTIAGIRPDGTITSIKIMNQAETPGLGSRITEIAGTTSIMDFLRGKRAQEGLKPWFQAQFSNKKTSELDDVQAITGATISSRTVIDSVKQKAVQIQERVSNER